MKTRIFVLAALLVPCLVPAAALAQEKKPTIVLRVNSLDNLIGHIKFLAGIAGQEDAARQIEGLIKARIGAKGFEGVDTARPFGFYGKIGKELDDVTAAVLIPIANENDFLGLLKNQGLQIEKGAGGIYTIKTGSPVDAYLRFANKYAYVTALNTVALDDKNMLDPAKVLAAKPTSTFSVRIQLDQVPDAAKLIASAQAEQILQEAQDKKVPNETPAQKAFRVSALKEASKCIGMVLREGGELAVDVELDQKAGDLAVSASLTGLPKSDLAAGLETLGRNTSMFAGLLKKGAALNGMGRLQLPESMAKALADLIDETHADALAKIQDPAKKRQAEALFKALAPTFKSGEGDGALVMTPSGKHFTLLAAVKIKDGDKLGKTIRDLAADAIKEMPPALQAKIKLDADSVGAVKIHKLEIPTDNPAGPHIEKLTGDPTLYVAFRDDALLLGLGKDGLQAVKNAVTPTSVVGGAIVYYEADVARLAATMAPPEIAAKATQLFPGGTGGNVRLMVSGGGALTIRLDTKVAVLQLLGTKMEGKAAGN